MSADDFQTKYSSVMEGMLKSAVAETTKLFQTMVDELKTEISNIKKENEDLKTRCSQFENASSQEAVSSRESEPHLGRRHGTEQRDTAVQCEPVPFRTMLVEQYQTLRDSSLQNPEPQCEHEDISYTLQEHNYVTNAKDNPQKAYILVKQEQSVLTDEEVEPTVVYGQVLKDKAGSSLAFACEIVNEDPLINPELSTKGIPLPQRHEENTVALELPCLGMDSKEVQFAQPTAIKNREALDELQNDVPKGEAISQPDLSVRRRRGRPAKKVKHLQQPVKEIIKSPSNLKNSPPKKVEEVEVLTPAGTVNTVVDRIKYPLSVTVESLRSRSSKKEKTSKSLQLSKKIQLSKEGTIKTPSTSVSFETETLKTPTSESVQPRKRHTSVTLQDAMLLVEAMNQSTGKNTLSSPQRMEAAHQTQWASCVGTLETVDPVTEEPQTPLLPVKIPEASGNVPVSELSTTEQLTKQELSAVTKPSDVPPNSGSLAHIKAVIPKDHHTVTNTSSKPSSTTATQTSVHSFKQHYPNPLIPSVAPSKQGNAVPHNVSVSASVSSLIPHKNTAISPTQLPSVLSTVVAAHKNGDLPAIPSTATGLNLGIPFLSSTFQKTIQVRPMKTIPVVSSQWTTNSNDPQPGKLQLPKVTIIIPRRVSAVALRKHQAPAIVLTTKQEASSPVKVSSSQLISSSKELSTSRDEQTTLAEVVPMSSQTWDNAADNLRPVNQTPSVSETKNEPIETCSTLPVSVGLVSSPMIQAGPLTAVVRLTRLPFQISPKESVSVSAVPKYKPSESQSILKAGTTQENPSTLVVSTQPLEMLGITTDINSNSKETSVAVSVNTLISEGSNGNQEKASVSSENVLAKLPDSGYVHPYKPSNMSALVFENSTLAFNTTNPPTVSAMASDPTSNVDEEIVSLSVQDGAIPNDPPIQEKKTASVIRLTSIRSKATLEPLSQMSKTQFLAQLAVTPVVQDRIKVYSNDSVGAKASCAETSTSDKKRVQKGALVTKLRSYVKTHLQVGRTERNREGLAEIEPPPVSPKKPRSEENSPNEENTTGVSPKTQGEAKAVTCLRQTRNQPTLISPRRSGLCKNGVTSSRTFNPTSASIRRSNGTSESTPLNLRSSRLDSGGGGNKIKKSTSVRTMRSSSSKESVRPNETKITSVSPRRSSLSKESVVPQKTKNTTVHAQRISARGSASPKITKTGTSPNNTKTITVRPKRTASPKKIKHTSDRISGLGKHGPSPKMSTNELTSGSHRCSLSKFSSPKSCSITSDGASTKNSKRSSLVVRGPKLDKDGVSPRKIRESTPAKKPKLCQDGTSRLKNNSRVANATKLAIAAKAQITAKLRNAKQTKLQNGAKTSQLPGTSTSSPATKRCIAKAVWTPPKVTVNKVSPARGKGSSPFPVKKERKSPRSQKPTVVFPPSVSLYPIPVRAPPIVSPLQPLSVIGWRLLRNQCGECGRVFSGSAALKRHVSLHKVRRPFSCTLCGKHFPDSKCLKRHGRVHRNGRIHVCQQCGKGFVYTFGLTKHIQTVHLKKKPFICKFCNKGFFTKRDMENHIRIHTGEKPFHCNLCERKFTRRVELNVHLRWHNGEKRHWCPYCGKGFLDYNNLKRHKYIHTGEKPESCPHCPKNFTQSGHLKKHVRNVHKIQ